MARRRGLLATGLSYGRHLIRRVKNICGAPAPEPAWDEKPHGDKGDVTINNTYDHGIKSVVSCSYDRPVEVIREEEYPHMNNGVYLDHSGTTIYATSLIHRFSSKMSSSLLGNPHSANEPAKLSGDIVDAVRLKALRFLGADPAHFDLVFVANATAAIKLVADSFRDLAEQTKDGRFWYGYHRDAHTSLVGVRELAGQGNGRCFESDKQVEAWLDGDVMGYQGGLGLFAWPGQSNLTGRRLELGWSKRVRESKALKNVYTLLDAAALAMTSPMARVFADPDAAPDFTSVSFYKIFGFPDLGGLVVRKDSGHILTLRKYFGGGTVSMVSTIGGAWHVSKAAEATTGDATDGAHGLHEGLEDGTLPFHSILALGEAIDVHRDLYGSMDKISQYTTRLVRRLYEGISALRYANGQPLCRLYTEGPADEAYGNAVKQGATIALNVFRADGSYESYAAVESAANERGVYVRSGGICCPGGIYTALQYEPWQLKRARSAGHHCGSDGLSVINELPTGVVRASLGAMSTVREVDAFISFLHDAFIGAESKQQRDRTSSLLDSDLERGRPEPVCSVG